MKDNSNDFEFILTMYTCWEVINDSINQSDIEWHM